MYEQQPTMRITHLSIDLNYFFIYKLFEKWHNSSVQCVILKLLHLSEQ